MGNSISGVLANIYVDYLESQLLPNIREHIGVYFRYVDDIFITTTNREMATHVLNSFNQIDGHISVTIEYPKEENDKSTISLLDFTVTLRRSGESEFEFYRKKARKRIFVHAKSFIPEMSKKGAILNETLRIRDRCSTEIINEKHQKDFRKTLRLMRYNDKFIDRATKDNIANYIQKEPESAQENIFLKVPFFGHHVNKKIKRILHENNIKIHLAQRSLTLRNLVKPKRKLKPYPKCQWSTCKLRSRFCNQHNVVYSLNCPKCGAEYVGSTVRAFHIRFNEHVNRKDSSVHHHIKDCKVLPTAQIIASEGRKMYLKFRESMEIRIRKPILNRKEEIRQATYTFV